MNENGSENDRLAYLNADFLASEEGRPLRILSEYLQPRLAFARERVQDTVVFFGSARLQADGPLGRYYHDARELARLVSEWSLSLPCRERRFVVCTGGGGGIMEAANRGAQDAGARSVGLNIGLPHEQRPNAFITPELSMEFHYFFTRKLWFAHLARAIVAFPGGFGTLDELCELLTLSQTKKLARPIPVLLYGEAYWREVINFDALLKHGMIAAEDLRLFEYVDTPASGLSILQRHLAPLAARWSRSFAKSVTCECDVVQAHRQEEQGGPCSACGMPVAAVADDARR